MKKFYINFIEERIQPGFESTESICGVQKGVISVSREGAYHPLCLCSLAVHHTMRAYEGTKPFISQSGLKFRWGNNGVS